MAADVRTSTVWDVLDGLDDLFDTLTFDPHSDTGETPEIWRSGEMPAEFVMLGGKVSDIERTAITFRGGYQESYRIIVKIQSKVAGQSQREARTRVAALSAVVENALRDSDTGVPTPVDVDGLIQVSGLGGATVEVFVDDDGFGCVADLFFDVVARI